MIRVRLPVSAPVFFLREGHILLARRVGTGYDDGYFGLVGGHLEAGETIYQAAIRESREEIGVAIIVEDLKVVGVAHYQSLAGAGIDFFFRTAHWIGEPAAGHECDQLLWCLVGQLPERTSLFARRAITHHVLAGERFDEVTWK